MGAVGWGILGCGRVAEQRVAPAIVRSPQSELIAFCSRTMDRAADFNRRLGGRAAYDKLNDFLADDRVEAIYVATPNSQHAEQTLACLAAGKHVLTDKPMALTVADARRMVEAAKRAGRTLGVLHQQRFHPAHAECFRLVRSGALGRLTMLRAEMGFVYAPADQWRQQLDVAGGGPGMDLAPHALDVFLHAAGPARAATGQIGNVRFEYPVEDFFHGHVEFECGAVGLLDMAYCAHVYGGRLEVRGDEGSFVAEGSLMAAPRYRWQVDGGPKRQTVETREGEFGDCFRAAVEDFSAAIRENREPILSGQVGLDVMTVIETIYTAARSARPLTLASPHSPTAPSAARS